MIPYQYFPLLTPENHRVTSPEDERYNCIAWAAGDDGTWWQPGPLYYWPVPDWPADDPGLEGLMRLFLGLGYVDCGGDASPEAGWQKVALYGTSAEWRHAARQLPSGWWASKLGVGADIEHATPEVVCCELYGEVVQIMKRPRPAPKPG